MATTDHPQVHPGDPEFVHDDLEVRPGSSLPYADRVRVRRDDAHVPTDPEVVRTARLDRSASAATHTKDAPEMADTEFARQTDPARVDRDHRDHDSTTDVVDQLSRPDNRAKMLLAIALMSLVTLILALVIAVDVLAEADEPVLVDGVPCLVQDDVGADGQAVLFCQR